MNETRAILESTVDRLFADHLDWAALTEIETSGWPEPLWAQIGELGIDRILADEDAGGMGAGWSDAYPVLRACGRYAVPLPVVETMICHWLARQAALELPDGVPGLVVGDITVAGSQATLSQQEVPWGRRASFLVAAHGGELVLLDPAGAQIDSIDNIGRDPRDSISGSLAIIGRKSLAQPEDITLCLGALVRSAQIAGAGAAALDLAVQYASEREQFGRPLSRFQAIQHHLADLAGVIASVDAITMAACDALDRRGLGAEGRNARLEIAAAKTRASEGVEKITRLSHQVHGAIGFTYEYGLHFLTRRLWAWRAEYGSASQWGDYLGGVALVEGGDGIWPLMTD